MATTVHLPRELLESVDRRAAALGVSRNRFVRLALERAIADEDRWSPRLVATLAAARQDEETHALVDEMQAAIASRRTTKRPPRL